MKSKPTFVNIGRLQANASSVIKELGETGRPAVVTNSGEFVAVILPISGVLRAIGDQILLQNEEVMASMRETELAVEAGERGIAYEDVLESMNPDGAATQNIRSSNARHRRVPA